MATGRVPTTANSPLTAKGDLFGYSTTQARVAVGSDGDTLVADSAASTGLRYTSGNSKGNPIINSSFDVWQRGTSFNGTAPYYGADRWFFARPGAAAGSTLTRQSAGLAGFNYCARMQRDNGNTNTSGVRLFYSLETADSIPYAGKTVTLSYYVRSGANYSGGSNAYITLGSGTGTDQQLGNTGFTGFSTVAANNSITPTSTWTRYSITGTVGSSATQLGLEIGYTPTGTAGANDFIEVTGIQLDEGSVALPYRRASSTLQGELAACQRYYWRTTATANSYQLFTGFGSALSVNSAIVTLPVPTKMRTSPSSVDFSTLALSPDNGAVLAVTNAAMQLGVGDAINVSITATGLLTQYRPYQLLANNSTSAYIGVSAEL
jgi:hypothetical protein